MPSIQSRCTTFKFSPLKRIFVENKIKQIASFIDFKITQKGIDALIKVSSGDMRKVINTLQATHIHFKHSQRNAFLAIKIASNHNKMSQTEHVTVRLT